MKSKFLFYSKSKNYLRKKFLLLFLFIMFSIFFIIFQINEYVSANNSNEDQNIEEKLSDNVQGILDNIDFSGLQDVVNDLYDNDNLFENFSITEKLSKILSGEFFIDYSKLGSGILNLIFSNLQNILPLLSSIISVGLLTSIIINFRSDKSNGDIIEFVCLSLVVTFILISFKDVLSITDLTINRMQKIMEGIFPILITLLTSIGAISTVSIFNPLVAILTSVVTFLFKSLLFPIFILIFLFTILNFMSNNIKLNKFIDFFNSAFKWSIGIIFSIFLGILSIQGVSAGKYDSISIKTTKFAVKSYIPIIGSYISESMDFIVLGSVLIKNAVGVVGVVVLFYTILNPVLNILLLKFGLQLSSSILEVSGNDKISNFIQLCSKVLILPIILILGVSIMFIMVLCLIMSTANIF